MKYAILLFSTSLFFSSFTYAETSVNKPNNGTEGSRNEKFEKADAYRKQQQIQTQTAKDLERLNTDVKRSQIQTQTAKDLAVLKKNVASNTSKKR